jgi:hypothetical protein
MVCYEILDYSVYMAALVIVGFGLSLGLFSGDAPVGVTLIPAAFGAGVIPIVVSMAVVDAPLERFLRRMADRSTGRKKRWLRRAATVPRALRSGLSAALALIRRHDPALSGVLCAWGFDIAALWASFRAFGHSPPGGVLVMSYYVGTLANTLPLPGGIGGVEGGMIGAFLAFGINAPIVILAVLAYRTISYWLPTVPGAIAYVQLRHTVAGWRSQTPDPRSRARPPLRRRPDAGSTNPSAADYQVDSQPSAKRLSTQAMRRRLGRRSVADTLASIGGSQMFPTDHSTPLFAGRGQARALETWREAASLVAIRWRVFLQAERESRPWAFASYVAALDAEAAAAADMAAMSSSIAA